MGRHRRTAKDELEAIPTQRECVMSFAWWPDLADRAGIGPCLGWREGVPTTVLVEWPMKGAREVDAQAILAGNWTISTHTFTWQQWKEFKFLHPDWPPAAHDFRWWDRERLLQPTLYSVFDSIVGKPTVVRKPLLVAIAEHLDGFGRPWAAKHYREHAQSEAVTVMAGPDRRPGPRA